MIRRNVHDGLPFPMLPSRWGEEERRFALGIRGLLEQNRWQKAYPVGIVVLSAEEEKPFTFGEWEGISTGITGVYGWKRVR